MTVFQVSVIVLGGLYALILLLTLSSLSASWNHFIEVYERSVPKTVTLVSHELPVSPSGNEETLETGVYHPTAQDLREYFKGRVKESIAANEKPDSWEYTDDEYSYSERRL